ncbi:MAG: TlpA family protein disulfide reductase [candidate division Zixibacteria bacterium]|nr:TlpA family protein disulfide reductase [candidate division Zixibacteria bacterium]
MSKTVLTILAAVILAVCFSACESGDSTETSVTLTEQAPAVATAATTSTPAEAGVSVLDLNGNAVSMSRWVGQKPVVVNFWGTWCPPCRREIPDLVKLYGEYKSQGVEIVSIAVRDTPDKVRAYAANAGMDWEMLLLDMSDQVELEKLARAFKLTGSVPVTIFYNAQGVETGRFVGTTSYKDFKPAFDLIS